MPQKSCDSPKEVNGQVSQEDPIIMYLIVRESLNMSIGKTAAQVGHAVGLLYEKMILDRDYTNYIEDMDDQCYGPITENKLRFERFDLFKNWQETSYTKVVKGADDKEWEKLKKTLPTELQKVVVTDEGRTEIAAGSETVMGLWPMRRSSVPKVVSRLQNLKDK